MAYAFRIHEAKNPGATAPTSAATMSGWRQTSHIAGGLLNNIELGLSSNKMGTSIPSLFARIFLFEGAFQTLHGQTIDSLKEITTDTKLVSECLDLIEFVFQHGNDPKLVVKRWNATAQIAALKNSGIEAHKNLAKVIEDEVGLYPNLNEIFLFYWNAPTPNSVLPVETLIGGTSPFTLVFTSPNWKRAIGANGIPCTSLNGTPLFDDRYITCLRNRAADIKNMIYSLHLAYNTALESQARYFNSYVATMMQGDNISPDVTAMAGSPANFSDKYTPIKDQNDAIVQTSMIPICYEQISPAASGYEIKATSTRYENYSAADVGNKQLPTPLALNDSGLGAGVNYISNSPWNVNTCKINEAAARTTPMHKRVLPGDMGIEHPYLIWSDFLEDKIIKLPYPQDNQNFNICADGTAQYVLPLKRTFFKYFNINEIFENVAGTNKKLVEMRADNNQVTVIINVPIHDEVKHTIEFKRIYKGEDIIEKAPFILGFFPFYRTPNDQFNRYSIMNCGLADRLRFYKVDNLDNAIPDCNPTTRTEGGGIISKTEYYDVNTSFDLIEVSAGGVQGLIIPEMKITTTATNSYNFAIDFGTSNTYIAHTTTNDPTPTTLEIDPHDQQTVFLTTKVERGQRLNTMKAHIAREFAPEKIGGGARVSYPCRTATCENNNFETQQPNLFGNISIGFNMMCEQGAPRGYSYKTGLKWLLEQHPGDVNHTNRIKNYFLQTLWMLKNESFLNDGDENFKVFLTFPETMKVPTRNALINLWREGMLQLNLNPQNVIYNTQCSESVAPYNCMVNHIGGASYLNVDIGGGTNDLLFVIKDNAGRIQSAKYASSMFAGDDLWGDGVKILANANSDNGFVEHILNGTPEQPGILANINTFSTEEATSLQALYNGVSTSSSDIMSFLFKHNNIFNTSSKIQGCKALYSVVFIHYAALMCNIGRLIKKMGIEIPQKMSFTGMGSRYLELISTNTADLTKLTKMLLEKYSGKSVPSGFGIISSDGYGVKEITAKGVLQGLNIIAGGMIIPDDALEPVYDNGIDYEGDLTYADIAKDEVRNSALREFKSFVESLKDKDFTNYLHTQFDLTIKPKMLDDLLQHGRNSFTTMAASIPAQHSGLTVNETLFFWPLKNSLIQLAKDYQNY